MPSRPRLYVFIDDNLPLLNLIIFGHDFSIAVRYDGVFEIGMTVPIKDNFDYFAKEIKSGKKKREVILKAVQFLRENGRAGNARFES